jgi:uncharacterized protein YlxW (UPF0749 family)
MTDPRPEAARPQSDPTAAHREPDPHPGAEPAGRSDSRQRMVSHLLIAVLCAVLGYAIIIQVRATDNGDTLATARPQDLVAILDGVNRRGDDLTAEIDELQRTLATLRSGGASSQAALQEAERRAQALAILAGTAAARGPGVSMVMTDPATGVTPEVLLAALQELRNAGAEAVQVNNVRLGVNSSFSGRAGAVTVDGTAVTAPYTILAIGDPPTLTAAMNIPGGVSDTAKRAGGTLVVTAEKSVTVDALRPLQPTTYARPAGG